MALTDAGLEIPSEAEILISLRASIDGDLVAMGRKPVNWDEDPIMSSLASHFAAGLSAVYQRLYELYWARSPVNAYGAMLSELVRLNGLERRPATRSTTVATITSSIASVAVPTGTIVTDAEGNRWKTTIDAITDTGAPYEASVTLEALNTGPIELASGQTLEPLSALTNVDSIVTSEAALAGRNIETDAELRARRRSSTNRTGASPGRVYTNVTALSWVKSARVVTNPSNAAAVVDGVSLAARESNVIVYPEITAPDTRITDLAEAIAAGMPPSSPWSGSESEALDIGGGSTLTVRWDWAGADAVAFVVTLVLDGRTAADAEPEVNTAIETYINSLSVGETVRHLRVLAAISTVQGVVGATVTIAGSATDYTPSANNVVTIASISVS